MSKPVIVLASGGLDSSLVMAKLLKEGREVVPLFSNYNQHAYPGESKAVRAVWSWLQEQETIKAIKAGAEGKSNPSSEDFISGMLFNPDYEDGVVEVHIDTGIGTIAACPGRVLSFVGAACIWAFTNGWTEGEIAIGIHKGDKDQDSCRVGYEDALNETVKSLTQNEMSIITPLMGMSREEMALEIAEIGIPWEIMYNCYWGVPCGHQSINMEYRCPGCRRKAEAMRTAGVKFDRENPIVNFLNPEKPITRRDWKKLV